jgi:crossover junction endodeoxyribonuclease RuvC
MRILGIDPGFATIGLGLIEATSPYDMKPLEWLTIQTKAGLPLADRLKEIADDLTSFLKDCKPDKAVVEKLYFATNAKTAIDVAHGRGVILLCLAQAAIPFTEATPLQLKSAIAGDGSADKRQIQEMMVRILKLQSIPQPDDAADALALAVYGALSLNELKI